MVKYANDDDKVEKFLLLDIIQIHIVEELMAQNEMEIAKVQLYKAKANQKFQQAVVDNKDFTKDQRDMERADFLLLNL